MHALHHAIGPDCRTAQGDGVARLQCGDWAPFFAAECAKPYFAALDAFVTEAAAHTTVYPAAENIFAAFAACPAAGIRAVILGQDPYHEPGQAMGLAFSVAAGTPLPPSLRNIYKELADDTGVPLPESGDLTAWAQRGVLLLNTVLTVERGKAASHAGWGWQRFTDAVIAATNALPQPIAFVLWGAHAQKKEALIHAAAPRLILKAPHPSPLSSYRGFFGSRPFSKINAFLQENGEAPLDWSL